MSANRPPKSRAASGEKGLSVSSDANLDLDPEVGVTEDTHRMGSSETLGEFDELYGRDAYLGDQYVMTAAEHPRAGLSGPEAQESLRDRAFIGTEPEAGTSNL